MSKNFTEQVVENPKNAAALFKEKSEQYGEAAPKANFTNAGNLRYSHLSEAEREFEAAKDMASKHVAHVYGRGQTINSPKIEESLKDLIVYSAIMLAMVQERRERESVQK